jgi:hypothetical protein
MDPLPIAPESCSLDDAGLTAQRERYRRLGAGATVIERDRGRIAVRVTRAVPDDLVGELISVERECCPFFELDWDPASRSFSVSVSEPRHQPALDAIAYALALGE